MVRSIIPTSHMSENLSTVVENIEYKIGVSKYCDHYEKSQNPIMPTITTKFQSLYSLHRCIE